MLIGLTGKYCAGKNYIASMIEARGVPVLDVDKLGYQVLETEKEAVFSQFGEDLRRGDGSLDRRLLGQRVFGNPDKLAALEAIVHPPVNRLTEEWIREKTEGQSSLKGQSLTARGQSLPAEGQSSLKRQSLTVLVINAALLHRSVVFEKLDRIIIVTAPLFSRILRAKRRDKLSWVEIFKRFTSQRNFNSQYLSVKAEIYRVTNLDLPVARPSSCAPRRRKLERRINEILEGKN